jgi:hypothetical protein
MELYSTHRDVFALMYSHVPVPSIPAACGRTTKAHSVIKPDSLLVGQARILGHHALSRIEGAV